MRLLSTKTSLLILTIFAIFIAKVVAHDDWDEDCEDESHDHINGSGYNDKSSGGQPNSPPYIVSSGVPYPAPTVAYPSQSSGPAQSYSLSSGIPPSRTDIPGLHPPEQNSASENGMLVSMTVYSIIISITMALMF